MFPDEWERWIVPKPTFLAEQLLREASSLAEEDEVKNRVRKHNIFEHFKEGFEKHSLPNLPPVFQALKEYKERSSLNPNLGNLLGCSWDSCIIKERGFWTAALRAHAQNHDKVDAKVYHAINFGQDYPDYKQKDEELPDDRPQDNDKRFSYYDDVVRWDTCQVAEERTFNTAVDKTRSWLLSSDMLVNFPLSQEESNRAAAKERQSGKGAKRRQTSVPPDSDTARPKGKAIQEGS